VRNPSHQPLLTPENVPLLTHAMYYDGSKARRELGVGQTPLDAAIAETAEWIDRGTAA
jgi:nucleoside-diphosphate-sugar epimerase